MEFTWNHRVVHHDTDPENEYFAIHEAAYEGGNLSLVSPHFASVLSDTVDGLHGTLNLFRDAMSHPVLRLSELYETGKMMMETGGA
jgi:hypothetical protein